MEKPLAEQTSNCMRQLSKAEIESVSGGEVKLKAEAYTNAR